MNLALLSTARLRFNGRIQIGGSHKIQERERDTMCLRYFICRFKCFVNLWSCFYLGIRYNVQEWKLNYVKSFRTFFRVTPVWYELLVVDNTRWNCLTKGIDR